MDYTKLEQFTYAELKDMATQMDLRIKRSKIGLVEQICEAFKEYEDYKRDKIDKYRKEQASIKGKSSNVYVVTVKDGTQYIMKVLRKHKTPNSLTKESELQKLAVAERAAPSVIDIDTVSNYIVMDKMERNLNDILKEQNGTLTKIQQKQIIHLYKKLDTAKVFHGDSKVSNYMYIGSKLRIIDFGNAKEINRHLMKKLGTKTPNVSLMTYELVSKLMEMRVHKSSYEYLCKYLSEQQIEQLSL
jgi:predicted Ser/Thr protein kinase